MQTEQSKTDNKELARKVRSLLSRTSALSALVREETNGDRAHAQGSVSQIETIDLPALRQGLQEVEQMTAALLNELQTDGELLLIDLPDLPLAEAFSQLVETTAETLQLSSRVVFSGHERPLSDYLARLLYHIAREALAQVPAHAGARRLRFSLDYQMHEITLNIEDDGIPGSGEEPATENSEEDTTFPLFLVSKQTPGSDPLTGQLRAIVENLGGILLTNSGVEQGTQIHVHIPYQATGHTTEPPTFTTRQEPEQRQPKIKLLIVDAQAVSRAGLHKLLESYRELEVVGEASDSVQAVSETAELLPQVVLIDAQLPGEQSLELLRQIRDLNPEIHAVLLSAQENEELLYETLRTGASGYILKDTAPDKLVQAIRAVARGEVLVQPQVAARLLASFGNRASNKATGTSLESLTAREREVLQLLARGLRNKDIAAQLFVSERTVNFHLANIYSKLHVSGRTEALSKALESGLLKM